MSGTGSFLNSATRLHPLTISIDNFSRERTQLGIIVPVVPDIHGPSIFEQVHQSSDFMLFPKKKDALDYLWNYSFNSRLKLFSEDINSIGAKRFVLSTREYIYARTVSTRAHLYENLEDGQPVKLHVDLDYKTNVHDPLKLNKLFARLVQQTVELFNKALVNYGVTNPQIIVLRSNQVINRTSENKVSGHLIYNNVVFADIYQMKTFFLSLKSELIDQRIIDKNIYRKGCFRMMGCSKKYKNNKLKFLKGINYKKPNYEYDLFFDTLVTELTTNDYHLVYVKGTIKTQLAQKIRQYSANNVVHGDNYLYHFSEREYKKLEKLVTRIPTTASDDYLDWLLVTYAFSDLYHNVFDVNYNGKIYQLWDIWCKTSKCYNKDINKKYFDTLALDYKDANHIPLVCNSRFRFKKYIKYEIIKGDFTGRKVVSVSERFLDKTFLLESISKYDMIFVKSPTGTGKTSFLESVFDIEKDTYGKPIYKSRSNFKEPIVSITPRKNLAKKHAIDLLLDAYDDKTIYLFDSAKLAVTANSLIYAEENRFRDGYVVLDEISQLLRYYKSRIMDGIRSESFKLLGKIVRYARKIIVLDADLTPNCIDTLITLRNSENYLLYHNLFQNRTGITAYFYDNPHIVAQMLVNDYKNRTPFVASFDSLTMMEALLLEMKQRTKSLEDAEIYDKIIKIYSSKHGTDAIDTAEWENNCVMFTPTITIGIDHNSSQATKSYAFAFKDILTAEDINQQIQRNRNQSKVHVYCSPKIGYLRYPNEESFKLETQERINKYNETIKELEEINKQNIVIDELDINDDQFNRDITRCFNKMYINTCYREQTMKVYSKYYLQCIMGNMGYNIIECRDQATDGFKIKKNSSSEEDREIITRYLNADGIEEKAQQAIKRKLDIMKIKSSDIDDTVKDVIMNDGKFTDYLCLRKFIRDDISDQIVDNYLRDFNETAANSVYVKLRYYKQLTDYLGIPKGLEYDYDRDKMRFAEKVIDKKILDALDDMKKCFRISGKKYTGFEDENGYQKLYKMTISICKQLFGNDILISKSSSIKICQKKITTVHKHNFNYKLFNSIEKFLST